MSVLDLPHLTPSCTGLWARRGPHWRCPDCGAVAYHSDEVAEAIRREREAGELLRTLTAEGRAGA